MRSERLLTSLLVAVSLLLSAALAAQSPQRTPTPAAEDGQSLPPPYRLVDNEYS
jgi:hypothetical protein